MTPCRTVAHNSIRDDGAFWAVATQQEILPLLSDEGEDDSM